MRERGQDVEKCVVINNKLTREHGRGNELQPRKENVKCQEKRERQKETEIKEWG